VDPHSSDDTDDQNDIGGGDPVEKRIFILARNIDVDRPDGEPLATLPTDQGSEAVAAELDKWVS